MTEENLPSSGSGARLSSSAAATLIQEEFLATGDAVTALAKRTAHVDAAVLNAAESVLLNDALGGCAVLAVGGYGRRQLFPYSDVDLLLLFESTRLAVASKDAIAQFLQRLWDSGMRVSHSVRTQAECLEVHDQNAELNVSLIDQRYLAGDRPLYAAFAAKLPRFIHASREPLTRNLSQLARDRHARFGNTIYHLEPNVKETPGGLRDYQLVCWLEQLRSTGAARVAAAEPAVGLKQAFSFLARLRCYLHCRSGRDNNALSFDAQDAIADQWQPGDAARWMRDYYRHARAVYLAATRALEINEAQSSSLFAQFRDWRSRLGNADFSVHRDRVHFLAPRQLDSHAELVLRLFEFVARHGVRPSFEAEQRIESRLDHLRAHFSTPQSLWPAIERILSLPHAPLAVRSMHETRVLFALLPELEPVECLVIRDFYHRYTVDEHTLVAMQSLAALREASDAGLKPYGDLLAEVKQVGLLMFALLFHDAGKAVVGQVSDLPGDAGLESHVESSARLAQRAMSRSGAPDHERETVVLLIRRHLELSAAMQSRDVFDPQTIRDVAHCVETVEQLKALTLLTYADISAVNPTAMTPWRAEQLWQLYLAVYNELTRELETERIPAEPSGPQERVAFLEGFPTRYLRTHTSAEIDGHIELEAASRKRGAAVDIRRLDSAWQLTVVTHTDRPGLFASLAGTLSAFGVNILKAEAFSNRRGLLLDTFTFSDPNRTLDLNPTEVDRLRATTERVIAGKADVHDLLRGRPKPRPPSHRARIPTRVSFDSSAGHTATLIEIVTEDRPGLLYDLASAITANGGNIEVVLIDTQAHKAIDVFYVTSAGKKLDVARQQGMSEALRRACGGPERT